MSSQPPPQVILRDLVLGSRVSQAISTAAELGLADHLVDGPKTVEDLAERTRTHAPTLLRLLLFLSGRGVFKREPDGRIAQSPLSELLRADIPGSLRTPVLYNVAPSIVKAWG